MYFRPGESILQDGIYRAYHAGHRVSHEVTLLAGEIFPACQKCGDEVHFQLLHEASALTRDSEFRVRLYKLPHPEPPEPSDRE